MTTINEIWNSTLYKGGCEMNDKDIENLRIEITPIPPYVQSDYPDEGELPPLIEVTHHLETAHDQSKT